MIPCAAAEDIIPTYTTEQLNVTANSTGAVTSRVIRAENGHRNTRANDQDSMMVAVCARGNNYDLSHVRHTYSDNGHCTCSESARALSLNTCMQRLKKDVRQYQLIT